MVLNFVFPQLEIQTSDVLLRAAAGTLFTMQDPSRIGDETSRKGVWSCPGGLLSAAPLVKD
jgi:hypothetical protein